MAFLWPLLHVHLQLLPYLLPQLLEIVVLRSLHVGELVSDVAQCLLLSTSLRSLVQAAVEIVPLGAQFVAVH